MDHDNGTRRPGDRNTSFGTGGEVTLSILPGIIGYTRLIKGALALPDNKILLSLVLEMDDQKARYGLARLTADGVMDSDFGNLGLFIDSFRGNDDSHGGRLLRLADGRLLMLGLAFRYQGPEPVPHLAMACYTKDYELDASFGDSGHLVIESPPNETVVPDSKVTQQADGKLLISSTYHPSDNYLKTTGVLHRLHDNGTLDTTFNGTGRLEFKGQDPNLSTSLSTCFAQADGKVVVAGHICFQPKLGTAVIARLNNNGTLDNTFGNPNSPGYHTVPVDLRWSQFSDLLPTASGFLGVGKVGVDGQDWNADGLLVGITSDGRRDPEFNEGKPLLTKYSPDEDNGWGDGYVQPDAKLVIPTRGGTVRLSRWLGNGTVDSEFGINGLVTDIYPIAGTPVIVIVRPNGKLLWTGNPTGIAGGHGMLISYLG